MPPTQHPVLLPFLEWLQFERRYSAHTVLAYQTDLEQFFQYLAAQFESPALEEISPAMVRSWLAEGREDGLEARTLGRKISALRSFFKHALRTQRLHQSPMVTIKAPRLPKRLPQFVTEVEWENLLAHTPFADSWEGRTEKLVLQVFYATGMRLSELVGLKEAQLDPANGQLKVLGKGKKERILPLSPALLQALQDYVAQKPAGQGIGAPVFVTPAGKALSPRKIYDWVHQRLSAVTTIAQRSPHVLRHSFATHLMNNGAELNAVKELLGHNSLAATQVYTHNSIDQLKEVFRKAHPRA